MLSCWTNILDLKLKYIDQWNSERASIADLYERLLSEINEVQTQEVESNVIHSRHIFPILIDRRDELQKFLAEKNIETLIHYKCPIHFHDAFSFMNMKKGRYKHAENICAKELSLLIYPGLNEAEITYICEQIKIFFGKS